jgi:hypothetical protein
MTLLLTKRDWTFLALQSLDVFAESQSSGALLSLFLAENMHADNALGYWSLALLRLVQGLYVFLFGNYLSIWPRDGPLRALVYGNCMQIVYILTLAMVSLFAPSSLLTYGLVLCLGLVLFAGGEAMGSVAFRQTVSALCDGRADVVQTALMNWSYSLGNVAIAGGASGVPLVWRWVFSSERLPTWFARGWDTTWWPAPITDVAAGIASSGTLGANVATLLTSVVCWTVSTTLLYRFHRQLAHLPEYRPSEADVAAFLKPKPCAELWARHRQQLRDRGVLLYVLVSSAIMFGVLNVFTDLGLVLPKYLIWRHGQQDWFPLYTAINPLLIAVLVPVVLVVVVTRVGCLAIAWVLVVGTSVQATAPLWVVVFPSSTVGTVVFLVQFTVGEAIAMPQYNDYLLSLVKRGNRLAYAHAIVQLPAMVGAVAQTLLSGALLNGFCADAASCSREAAATAPYLWLVVSLLACTTPLGFAALGILTMHRQEQDKQTLYTKLEHD